MYPKEFFLDRFKNEDTETLLQRYSSGDLADEAKAAILEILSLRSSDKDSLRQVIIEARKRHFRATKGTDECDFCRNSARRSPVLDGGQRFCSSTCCRNARLMELTADIPEEDIRARAQAMKSGACPVCRKDGSTVEVRRHHTALSAVFFTSVQEHSKVCCQTCGRKENMRAIGVCLIAGWWGIPWGIFLTPIQIVANILEMFRTKSGEPSEELAQAAQIVIGEERHQLAGATKIA